MDDISLALNPPRLVKIRRPPIQISDSSPCVWPAQIAELVAAEFIA